MTKSWISQLWPLDWAYSFEEISSAKEIILKSLNSISYTKLYY